MMPMAEAQSGLTVQIVTTVVIFMASASAVFIGYVPLVEALRAREHEYDMVLRHSLLMETDPRSAVVLSMLFLAMLALGTWVLSGSMIGLVLGFLAGVYLPTLVLRYLRNRRLGKIEDQLVSGIQTLAAGVRAGLNLVQAMQLVAKEGPTPLKQEFAHLLREYEYGLSLDEAMANAATRIGSGDVRLLFSALLTHRERGGDLGMTLDRIAESIREIQRLENRVKTLTAQGRATARWLGAMPVVIMLILYFLVDSNGVKQLFIDDLGKLLLLVIVILNIFGFLWIRKIVSVDI